MNKPIVAVASGQAYNSGVTLLSACGYPMMTENTKIAFNECTFGFVPHSGATYYLSRLPSEFGTFMALTGLPIKGADASQVGLVDGVLEAACNYDMEVADVVLGQEPGAYSAKHLFYHKDRMDGTKTQWEQFLQQKYEAKRDLILSDFQRYNHKLGYPNERSQF